MLVDAARYVQGKRQDLLTASDADGYVWFGLSEPSREELLDIERHVALNDFAVEDAVTNHQRPKIDQFDEHTFIVVRTIAYTSHGE